MQIQKAQAFIFKIYAKRNPRLQRNSNFRRQIDFLSLYSLGKISNWTLLFFFSVSSFYCQKAQEYWQTGGYGTFLMLPL